MKPSLKDPGPGSELGCGRAHWDPLLMANHKRCTCTHAHQHACVSTHTPMHTHARSHTVQHTRTHTNTHTQTLMCACTHTHAHPHKVHTHASLYTYTHIHMYPGAYMHTCTRMHTHPHKCTCMPACTCTHIHMCPSAYVHMCTHAHTQSHQGLAAFLSILVHCEATQVQPKWEDYVGFQLKEQHVHWLGTPWQRVGLPEHTLPLEEATGAPGPQAGEGCLSARRALPILGAY